MNLLKYETHKKVAQIISYSTKQDKINSQLTQTIQSSTLKSHSRSNLDSFFDSMNTQRNSSMYRSGTTPFSLPKINKLNLKESRYNQTQNRSSFHINISKTPNTESFIDSKSPFTTRVQKQILDENQYPYTETKSIQKQHSRLKDLIKQFNEETVVILEKYVIDKPVIKERVKKKHQIKEMYFIRDKQAQNAHNMILLMKHEIQKLQSRCENLKYTSKQEFEHKIKQLKQQKQKKITQNKQISRQITLNGLQIVRGKQSLVKQLEYEQFLIDSKRDRLKKQSDAVTTQIASLQAKTKELNNLAEKYEQQESYTLKKYEELERQKSQNRLYEESSKKKKLLEHNKIINQSSNYQLKHKYFQKLKELDQFSLKQEDFNKKMKDFQDMISETQNTIKNFEKKELQINNKSKSVSINAKINLNQTSKAQVHINLK